MDKRVVPEYDSWGNGPSGHLSCAVNCFFIKSFPGELGTSASASAGP
jgi:hypothetical protein